MLYSDDKAVKMKIAVLIKGESARTMKPTWKTYLLLHLLLFINSLGGVCSKFAGRQEMFSLPFFVLYGMVLLILAIYAVVWQQVIKRMPLSTAYLNKPISMIWGILWGIVFFQEQLTVRMVIGAVIVLAGMIMVVQADE